MAFKFLEKNVSELTRMILQPKAGGDPVDGFVDDQNTILFQFPPRCLSDSKRANWNSPEGGQSNLGYESIRIYGGSEARAISLEHEYLVVDKNQESGGSSLWSINRISAIVKNAKAHFYRPVQSFGKSAQFDVKNAPHIELQLYNQVELSGTYSTWRALSVSITHGEEIIIDNGKSFPLKTKIAWELELSTKLNFNSKDGVISDSVGGVSNKIKKEWY